jgi:transcriptional regulator with XRE-family HTH domain
MKDKAAKIRQEIKEFADTPEGKALNTRMKLARNIIALLKAKKFSQAEFARSIGMKPTQFSRIVQGDENITLALVSRIADGFGVPDERLFKAPRKSPEPAGTGR